jgi:regulator of PEP synthase PpsR (kinase-PPPase family)
MALQFGIRAANYPLIPEDFDAKQLPSKIRPHKHKLFGLTIRPDRLQRIRNERRPGSKYASLENCEFEIREADVLMRQEGISVLDTTTRSIEELATTILQKANLQRHVF